ncbi:MAG: beta-N-acetylhexosaminidase [Planctomycetia bacterium]|nr:MAG: beta-N-acetylhexosaminidase [Planctomycetia bacterium]
MNSPHSLPGVRPRSFLRAGLPALVLLALTSATPSATAQAPGAPTDPKLIVLEHGRTRVEIRPWNRGMSVFVDSIRVSGGSNLVITTPPWAPHHYLGPTEPVVLAAREAMAGASSAEARPRTVTLTHRGKDDVFTATETITIADDGSVTQVFEGRFHKADEDALAQYQIAAINPTLIVGRNFSATKRDGSTVRGVVPVNPRGRTVPETTLAANFTTVEFDSRVGVLRLEFDTPRPLTLYDHRATKWSDPGNPLFWLGDLGTRFRADDTLRFAMTIRLPAPTPDDSAPLALERLATVERLELAQSWPLDAPPVLMPRPKECSFPDEFFVLRRSGESQGSTRIHMRAEPLDGPAATLLARRLREWSVLAPTNLPGEPPSPGFVFEPAPTGEDLPPEWYDLSVRADGVRIRAADERGFLHAVHTLRQLACARGDGAWGIRGATIRDWPSLPIRGVHVFTGGQGADPHLALLEDVIGALKMNHIILEAQYIHWDAFPEIRHAEYGMPKTEVRRLIERCRALRVDLTPLISSLGHMAWMFTNNQNLDLAEDPEAKWAYCVTNPAVYDFIFQVHRETLELFEPAMLHIGHDEFHHRGKVPGRESSKPYTVEQLFLMDTLRHRDWLRERGVRTVMWGDMLLAKTEAVDATHAPAPDAAKRLRDAIPDDVLIADWHYAANPWTDLRQSLDIFHNAGHHTLACTWNRPHNITGFARAAYETGSLGLIQTTWAGYSLDEARLLASIQQYAAYVLAAEAGWNADNPPDPDAYPWFDRFLRLTGRSQLSYANRSGWTVDLAGAANLPLGTPEERTPVVEPRSNGSFGDMQTSPASDAPRTWFDLGVEHSLANMPIGGTVSMDGLKFRVGADGVLLRGGLAREPALPTEVTLTLGDENSAGRSFPTARMMAFLHTTNFATEPGRRVAEYEIEYSDGQREIAPAIYGETVFAYNDGGASAKAPLVWSGRTPAGAPVWLHVQLWQNPTPQRPIRALRARSANAPASLILLGVTGLE